MRLFIIFEVTTPGDPEEPLFRQVHHEVAETGNGYGVEVSKQWAAEHAKADTLYCTAEVFNFATERRYRSQVFAAYYWRSEATVREVSPTEFGTPFHTEPQAEEEGRQR